MNKFSSSDSKELSKTVKLYTDWVNRYLEKLGPNQWINVLQVDLCDGVLLADLINAVLNTRVPSIIKDPKNFSEQLHNVEVCLSFLKSQGVNTSGLKGKDIQHGSLKDILCLLYNLSEYKHKYKDSNSPHQPQTTKTPRAESSQPTPTDHRFHPRLPVRQPSSSFQESSAVKSSHPSAALPPHLQPQSHQQFDYSHCYSIINIPTYQKTSTQMSQEENDVTISSHGKQTTSKLRGSIPISSSIPSRRSSSSGYATNSLGRSKATVIDNNSSNTAMSLKKSREGSVPPSITMPVQTGIPKPSSARSKTQSESETSLPVRMLGTGAANLESSSSFLQKPSSKLSKLKMFSSKDSLDSRPTDDEKLENGKSAQTQKIPGYSISTSINFSHVENNRSHIPSSKSQSKLSLIIPNRSAESLPHHSAASSIPSGASSIPSGRLLPNTPQDSSRIKNMREKSISPRRSQKSPSPSIDPTVQSRARDATSRQESNLRRSSCSSTASVSTKMPISSRSDQMGSNIRPPSACRSAQSTAEKKTTRRTGIASAKTRQPRTPGIPAASSPSDSSVMSLDSVSSTSSTLPRNAKSAKGTKENFGSADKLLLSSRSKTANAMKAVMLGASASKSELKPPLVSTKRSSDSSIEESLEATTSLTRLPVAGSQKSLQKQKSSKNASKITFGKSSLENLAGKGIDWEASCPNTPLQMTTDDSNGLTKETGPNHTKISRMPRYSSQLPRGSQPGMANQTHASERKVSDGVQPLSEKRQDELQRKSTLGSSQEDVNNNQNEAFISQDYSNENFCDSEETREISCKLEQSKSRKAGKKFDCEASESKLDDTCSNTDPPLVCIDDMVAQGCQSPLRTNEPKNAFKSETLRKNSSSATEDLGTASAASALTCKSPVTNATGNTKSESADALNYETEKEGVKRDKRNAFVMNKGVKKVSKQTILSTSEENSEPENLSAFDVKPMDPITRCVPLSGGIGGLSRGQTHRKLPALPSQNQMLFHPSFPQEQGYLGMSDDRLNMGLIDAEAGYMSDGDYSFGNSHHERLNYRFVNNDGMLHYKKNHHSVEEIPNAWKRNRNKAELKDDDSFDESSSVSSDEIKEAIAQTEVQQVKRLEGRSGVPYSATVDASLGNDRVLETLNKTQLPSDSVGFLRRGLVERTTLPSRGKRAVLPVTGFVKKSQQVAAGDLNADKTQENDSSFTLLDLEQVIDKSRTSADSGEMMRSSTDRSITSRGDASDLEDQKGDKLNYFKHMNTLPRSHDRPNASATAGQSGELFQQNLCSSFPSSISSNSMFGQLKTPSYYSSMERRYGSLGRRGMALGAKDVNFGSIGKTGGSSIIQDGGQSFFGGTVISNTHTMTSKLDPGGRQYLLTPERKGSSGVELFDFHDYADLAKSTGLSKRRVSNPANSLHWTRTDASQDTSSVANSDISNTLGTPLGRRLRSQHSIDSSLDSVRSKNAIEMKLDSTLSMQQMPPLMSESLSKGSQLSKQPSCLSQSSSHRSGLGMSSDNILHGSSLSLGSNSSMYSAAEELQAQEIRKLRQDLELAQAKVSTLNMQVSTNEHVICAFEQSLTSMTQRLQELATITDKKDSEVRELRSTIDLLRQQTRINSSASSGHLANNLLHYDETDPHFSVDTISCSGSIGQLSNSSDGDRKKKPKSLFASIGKAFNRKKNKSGSLLDQDLDGCGSGSGESLSQLVALVHPLPESTSVPSTPLRSSASDAILVDAHKKDPLSELEKQLHEKEMKLTDVQLEALTSAHQLEQMRNNMTRMKNEILYLKADNDRMQHMMSQKGIQPPALSLSSSQLESHRISLECPANLEILLGDDGNREAPKIMLSVNLNQHTSDCSPGQELKPQTILIGQLTVSEKTNWENLNRIVCGKFKDYCFSLDPETGLGLSVDSVKSFSIGEVTWSKGGVEVPELLPCGYLVGHNLNISLLLRGVDESRTDSLAFETLIPKSIIQRYVTLLTDHRRIILNGPSGTGKTYLARKLAEYLVLRSGKKLTSKSVSTYNVDHKSNKELRQYLSNIADQCEQNSADLPSVIILDNLHHVASLGEVFDGFLSVRNRASPYMIGTMNHVTGSTTDLQLHHNFRWVLCANHVEPVQGFLSRYLRRRLIEDRARSNDVCSGMDSIIEWLPKVWQHLNRFLETHSCREVTIGPRLFLSCPMNPSAVQTWFIDLWNYSILPYMMEAVREGIQSYGCRAPWEDPAQMVIKTCPWNQSPDEWTSLLRLRPEDVGYDGQMTPTTAANSKSHPIAQGDNVTTDPLLKLNMLLGLQDAANSCGTVSDNEKKGTEKS